MALTKITSTVVSDAAVTVDKLADGSITTAKIASGAITADKLSANSATDGTIGGWTVGSTLSLSLIHISEPTRPY